MYYWNDWNYKSNSLADTTSTYFFYWIRFPVLYCPLCDDLPAQSSPAGPKYPPVSQWWHELWLGTKPLWQRFTKCKRMKLFKTVCLNGPMCLTQWIFLCDTGHVSSYCIALAQRIKNEQLLTHNSSWQEQFFSLLQVRRGHLQYRTPLEKKPNLTNVEVRISFLELEFWNLAGWIQTSNRYEINNPQTERMQSALWVCLPIYSFYK